MINTVSPVKEVETIGGLLDRVRLPGEDILKTVGASLLALLMILLTNDTPFYSLDTSIESVVSLKAATLLALLLSILFFIGSIAIAVVVRHSPPSLVRSYWLVYAAKYVLDIGLLLLFGSIGIWVISLGGITRSPFSCVLSLTPALFLITILRDRKRDYGAVYDALGNRLSIKHAATQHARASRAARIMGAMPLVIVGLVLTVGQCCVAKLALHDYILPPPGTAASIAATGWYVKVYYTIFFLSVGLALYGGLWSRINFTRSVAERLLHDH